MMDISRQQPTWALRYSWGESEERIARETRMKAENRERGGAEMKERLPLRVKDIDEWRRMVFKGGRTRNVEGTQS